MVDPTLIPSILYFLAMIMATLAAGRLFIHMRDNTSAGSEVFISSYSKRWLKYSFIALFLFFLLNLLAESLAWICIPFRVSNYLIYKLNYLLNIPAIFIFFAINTRGKIFSWILVVVYAVIIYDFAHYKMWLPENPISFTFAMVLFSGWAIVSTIFLASNLISHSKYPNRFKIRLGIVFLVYTFLGLFIVVFVVDRKLEAFNYQILFLINIILATLFYGASAIVMLLASRQVR